MHLHLGNGESGGPSRVLKVSLFVTVAYIVLLVVSGIRAHSLALLSEAGHNLTDLLALVLSLTAVYLQNRPPSATKTYGYHRAGVLAALINAVSLVAVSFIVFYEAFRRIQNPEHVRAGLMIGVAAAGVVMNGVIALSARNWRHALNCSGYRRWLGNFGDRPVLDRFGAIFRHWCSHSLVLFWHCA